MFSKVAAFLNHDSSLTSDILMTILPSYLIDASTLLCIFSVVFIELVYLTFSSGVSLRARIFLCPLKGNITSS